MTRDEKKKFEYILENIGYVDLEDKNKQYLFNFFNKVYEDTSCDGYPMEVDLRTKLHDMFDQATTLYLERKKEFESDREPMCMKIKEYDAWCEEAGKSPIDLKNYCDDCNPTYQKRMMNKGLCVYPETKFFAKPNDFTFQDEQYRQWEMVGVRVDYSGEYECRGSIELDKDNWIEEMEDLNMTLYQWLIPEYVW